MSAFFKGKKIFVAGHRGMVGSAICRALEGRGATLLTAPHAELDLTQQAEVEKWFAAHKPDLVFLTAAKVGGILANTNHPAEFLYDNLMIEANVIHTAHCAGVKKLLFLGSSCIYPKFAEQPIREEALLTGPLEETNEWYAIAKIAGIKLCQAYRKQYGAQFISAQPTNLYGPGDNFDLTSSHVIPALVRKFHEAKLSGADEVEIWGSGTPRREFLHVDDLAAACLFLMEHYDGDLPINIGTGEDITIKELAETIGRIIGYKGGLRFDTSKPDGTPRKLLDVSRLNALGWRAETGLQTGLKTTYEWYQAHRENTRKEAS